MYKHCQKAVELKNINIEEKSAYFHDDVLGNCRLEFSESETGAISPYMIVTENEEYIEYYETDIVFFNLFEVVYLLTNKK